MGAEDHPGEHSFDELARGLASGSISRRKALRLMGAALLGGTLASIPGVALAAPGCPEGTTKCGPLCCNSSLETCEKGGHQPRCVSWAGACAYPDPVCPRGTYCCCTREDESGNPVSPCVCCPRGQTCGIGLSGPICV
jgi:hypothetical protein